MELQRLSLCIAFLVLAVISQCSEGRHAIRRRGSDYTSDEMFNDESNDYGAQNDADGGNDADEDDAVEDGVILTKGDHYRLLIGRSVRLECRTSPAEGTVVSWSKNEEKIFFGKSKLIQSDRFSLVPNSSDLLIRDLELSDTGRYTCQIMQMSPASITHVVIVEEPPRVNRFSASDNGELREGSDLLLTCEVSGTPKPSILWSRQKQFGLGTESLTEANGEFSNTTFFMKNISREDSGAYYCYAVSDAGNATAVLTVTIVGKPRVHVHRPVVNTDIGVEAQLQCSVHEEPTPFIRWYKDDSLIEDSSVEFTVSNNGSLSTLTVTPRKDGDFGMFTCEAQNAHDVHSKSIELVQRPVVENLDVQGPKLTWTVHSHQPLEDIEVHLKQLDGEGELTTFKVPLPESKAHEYELIYVLDNDKVQDGTYEATVKVRNNKSWSRHSDPARVKLERQAEPIQTASVFRGNNSAHSVRPTTFALTTILMYLLVRML